MSNSNVHSTQESYPSKREGHLTPRERGEKIQQNLLAISANEEKIAFLLQSLQDTLFQEKVPHFKTFWDTSKLFLELVKGETHHPKKKEWLDHFSHLSDEAKRLRDIRDEESAFHVEQFEGAISAIEKEWEEKKEGSAEVEFPIDSYALEEHKELLLQLQGRLLVLQALFIRVNSLRKELALTEMRIRTKNSFFDRLTKLADAIFPERKQLMDELSSKFAEAVKRFVDEDAKGNQLTFFQIRDEIKALQALAKWFVLNATSFKETRLSLSALWDALKAEEAEFKKAKLVEREGLRVNFDQISQMISQLKQEVEANTISKEVALKRVSEIQIQMKKKELSRNDIVTLRQEIRQATEKYEAEERRQEEERILLAKKKEAERKEKLLNFKNEVLTLTESSSTKTLSEISLEETRLQEHFSQFNRQEKALLEKEMRAIRELISSKKEAEYRALPEKEREAMESQEKFLQDRKERRREIQQEIEALEKMAARSGMNLGKAFEISERIADEKKRLYEIEETIVELEEKIGSQ